MADFGGVNIETPQEVIARITAQRQKAAGSGNRQARQQIVQDQVLDALFGNRELQAATEKEGAMTAAAMQANDEARALNLNPEQADLRKLSLIRDSLEELDPQAAIQLTQNLQTSRIQELERQKLGQSLQANDITLRDENTRFALNPDTLQSEAFDTTTVEGAQRLQEARADGRLVSKTEDGLVNLFNAERARQFTERQDALARQADKEEAELERISGVRSLGTSRKNQIDGSIEATRSLLDQYQAASRLLLDPDMLRIASRVSNFSMTIKDFVGLPGISPTDVSKYQRFTGLAATVASASNRLIKERSGATVTDQEMKRVEKEVPGIDDNPIKFMEKMNRMSVFLNQAQRRVKVARLRDDFTILDTPGEEFADPTDILFGERAFVAIGGLSPDSPTRTDRISVPGPGTGTAPLTALDILNRNRVSQ